MNLSDLLNDVLVDCPGAPEPLIIDALIIALREFCNRTRFWQQSLSPINLVAGQAIYPLNPPTNTEIVSVMQARTGHLLVSASTNDLDRDFPGWRDAQARQPVFYFQPSMDSIHVVYKPSENISNGLSVIAALRPARNATTMDDEIYREFGNEIISGAKAHLQLAPNKPWSAPDHAAANALAFSTAINRARIRVFKSNTRGPTIAVAPAFGF